MAKQKATNGQPRHRGRTHLTEADIAHMSERRVQAAQEKQNALKAIKDNPQFTNAKLWAKVPAETAQAILNAIQKGGEKAKAIRLAELKAQVAELEGPPVQE